MKLFNEEFDMLYMLVKERPNYKNYTNDIEYINGLESYCDKLENIMMKNEIKGILEING